MIIAFEFGGSLSIIGQSFQTSFSGVLNRQEQSGEWSEQKVFASRDNNHDDWVRDVAWAPSVGLPTSTIASCSEVLTGRCRSARFQRLIRGRYQDKSVIIWIENAQGQWRKTKVLTFDQKVLSVVAEIGRTHH